MKQEKMKYHFAVEQKAFCKGEVRPFNNLMSSNPLTWAVIDDVVHVSVPFGNRYLSYGHLIPIKETVEELRTAYKEIWDIDIPEDATQWPSRKAESDNNKEERV